MNKKEIFKYDVLVIGAGIAGCTAALKLSRDKTIRILLVTKDTDVKKSSTSLAQGGIIEKGVRDTKEKLVRDILIAGDGLCNRAAVETLANDGPRLVREFLAGEVGVEFTIKDGKYDYTKEAAHSVNRILYKNDHTGREIEDKLTLQLKNRKNIKILLDHTLIDLITIPHHSTDAGSIYEDKKCVGGYFLDNKRKEVIAVLSKKVILATGGVGQVYQRTTNPDVATGDGLAAASRAGVEIINAEYVQFHPTSLFHRDLDNFLISESVRGEGGRLKNHKGESFMEKYDRRGSLAPRDIVARGIYEEMAAGKRDFVYLDLASHMEPRHIIERFPLIYRTCLDLDLDITKKMIPVAPTAHYFCGGIKVDINGQSSLENLYAIGEVSCTGVHGANRLASTSLLEGLVWGARCAKKIGEKIRNAELIKENKIKKWVYLGKERADAALVRQDWNSIKSIMWNYVGIVRTPEGMDRAVLDLAYLKQRIEKFYRDVELTRDILELRSGVQAALVIAESARKNKVSRGCHYVKNQIPKTKYQKHKV
ncbi:MAG: L-aspartate oxidase [Candidatus Paceibacterota bacterium]|jgi:L-aspartate oxidase